jgi:hypothetical protein
MESQSTTELPTSSSSSSSSSQGPKTRLVDIAVTNQNEALQLIVTFLNLAQKRGAFTMDESAKIWECVKFFQ